MSETTDEVSFEGDIQPLFSERDQEAMLVSFDLWDLESVKDNAQGILEQVDSGRMPCYGAWPKDQVDLFRRRIDGGMQA